jgi:hypothetical protein
VFEGKQRTPVFFGQGEVRYRQLQLERIERDGAGPGVTLQLLLGQARQLTLRVPGQQHEAAESIEQGEHAERDRRDQRDGSRQAAWCVSGRIIHG